MPNSRIKEAAAMGSRCYAAGFRSRRGSFRSPSGAALAPSRSVARFKHAQKIHPVAGVANFVPKAKARSGEFRNEIKLTPQEIATYPAHSLQRLRKLTRRSRVGFRTFSAKLAHGLVPVLIQQCNDFDFPGG